MNKDYCVLDIETAGGDLRRIPEGFELLVAGLKLGVQFQFFLPRPHDLDLLVNFLESFNGTVVTFNGTRFDLPVLRHQVAKICGRPLGFFKHYDLLAEIYKSTGFRVSLDHLANDNLGVSKLPWKHRQNARIWKEEPAKLLDYNRNDLELTAALYEIVISKKPLRVHGRGMVLRTYPL